MVDVLDVDVTLLEVDVEVVVGSSEHDSKSLHPRRQAPPVAAMLMPATVVVVVPGSVVLVVPGTVVVVVPGIVVLVLPGIEVDVTVPPPHMS